MTSDDDEIIVHPMEVRGQTFEVKRILAALAASEEAYSTFTRAHGLMIDQAVEAALGEADGS